MGKYNSQTCIITLDSKHQFSHSEARKLTLEGENSEGEVFHFEQLLK